MFHHPELGAVNYSHHKYPTVNTRILISNKMVFCVSGTEIHGLTTVWKIPLRQVGNVIVRDLTVVAIDENRGIVCEVTLPSIEEAYLV
jgi:hypothetical protein